MPHRIVDQSTVDRLKGEIERLSKAISLAREFAAGGKEAFKKAIEILEHRNRMVRDAKDAQMVRGTPSSLIKAERFFGQEEAYSFVLSIFRDPKKRVNELMETKKELERELGTYRKYEVRKS